MQLAEDLQTKVETLQALNHELRAMVARTERQLSIRNSFIRALLDPDVFGYAVENVVREEAWRVIRGTRD